MSLLKSSVLDTVKKHVGLFPEDGEFDVELINHINSALFVMYETITLTTMPMITSRQETWEDILTKEVMEQYLVIPSYIGLRVKLIFDTPINSFAIEALKKQISEYEYRMSDKDILLEG